MTPPRILVVEDEGIVARDIERQLQDLGYESAGIAASGEEAVELAGIARPRLVLMDIHLAGAMDGIAAAVAIRTQFGIPCIFLTAYATKDVVRDAKVAEPLGYIIKPFDELTLRTTVELALHRADTEDQLRQSEARYRRIVETSEEAIWTLDEEDRITFVNPKAVELFGYPAMEMVGASILDFVDTERRAGGTVALARRRAGVVERMEFMFRRKDGSELWMLFNASPLTSDAGDYLGSMGLGTDITQSKLRTDRLRLQAAALDAAANAIVITDVQGTIVWANPALTTLTGYSLDEAVGRTPGELLRSGVHDADFFEEFWRTILAGRVWRGEMTNCRKDGSQYVEEQTVTPVKGSDGRITHFVAIKKDLTEQRALQAEFLQAQKMEAIGQLASGVAHDFNNLLTAILGYTEFLLLHLESDEQRADAAEIIKAGNRAAALTKQLLAFSRKQALNPTIVNVGQIVADVKDLLRRVIGEHIELVAVSDENLPVVRVDAGQLEQVLMNLCVNARDAMPDGGRLTVETTRVDLDGSVECFTGPAPSGRYVRLAVSDTGSGMSDDTKRRAMEPFFTTKGLGKGTGLGLSTVYGIIKQSGGYLAVDSALGRGTTITVYLPVAQRESADLATIAPGRKPAGGTETVLLVEDDEGVRLLVRTILERAGYRVTAAAEGAEAERTFDARPVAVDILLTDIVMPGGTGVELYRRLAAKRPGLRVVFMSGYTDPAMSAEVEQIPNAVYLQKPFAADKLVRSLREALDR